MSASATDQPIWRLGDKSLDCSRPRVVAIVNVTPDSFFEDSRLPSDKSELRNTLAALLEQQPDVVDIGGQSSRPGSARIDATEELRRVLPVLTALRELSPDIPLTIDTYDAQVARIALAAGADGINDISAGRLDPALLDIVAESGCGYVLMHMLGTPESMQQAPHYDDCPAEVAAFLASYLVRLKYRGIGEQQIVLDPGVGFGKRVEDNIALVRDAARFAALGRPLLFGISRKMFIGKLGGAPDAAGRLPGTLGLTWELLSQGVMLHRVHDAAETRQLIRLWEAVHGD